MAESIDSLLLDISDYVLRQDVASEEAMKTARHCLMDSLGCAFLALRFPECRKLLGPVVPGLAAQEGARVPGTSFVLDPVTAAFNIGAMVRWLDYNDTWLAKEWGHPSDNLGAILAAADWVGQGQRRRGGPAMKVEDLLLAMVQAHEIQGILALENAFNRVGLDHVLLVRVASTAVAAKLLGLTRIETVNAVSNAWVDGGSLRCYRHFPNTGSRKSWAAGDATARAVWLAFAAKKGEMGYPTALSAKTWGFSDVFMKGEPIRLGRSFGSYVMENVLFKISYPAEFHAQTSVEAAVRLHPQVASRLDEVEKIVIHTHESAIRIISKTGPLKNPADRDHCLQYMVAVALLRGNLTAEDYEDDKAANPAIDALREKMQVVEEPRYSQEYLDPDKRSIASALQVFFKDGTATEKIEVEYPIGHRRRRAEGIPILEKKFQENLHACFGKAQREKILSLFEDPNLLSLPVPDFVEALVL